MSVVVFACVSLSVSTFLYTSLNVNVFFSTEHSQCSEIMCNQTRDKNRPPTAPDRGKCGARGRVCVSAIQIVKCTGVDFLKQAGGMS